MKNKKTWLVWQVACILSGVACAYGADFKQGDVVTLSRDEPLYFKDTVYRQGTKGETFTVYLQNSATHKVYVVTKDVKGQPIGLSISEDALAAKAPPLPLSEPPSSDAATYSEEETEAANQTGLSPQGLKKITDLLVTGGLTFRKAVYALKLLDYWTGKACDSSIYHQDILQQLGVEGRDMNSVYKTFARIAKRVADFPDDEVLSPMTAVFGRSTARELIQAIHSKK